LARQTLHRPPMPADHWEYWKFDGEFWIDEIGNYRHTLKRGCSAATGERQMSDSERPLPRP